MLIRVTPLTQDEHDQLTAMVGGSPLAKTTLLGRTPSGRLLDFKAEDVAACEHQRMTPIDSDYECDLCGKRY